MRCLKQEIQFPHAYDSEISSTLGNDTQELRSANSQQYTAFQKKANMKDVTRFGGRYQKKKISKTNPHLYDRSRRLRDPLRYLGGTEVGTRHGKGLHRFLSLL